ncbi:uncharacterized protein LOC108094910 [Drosophila ficusphila]|uniref:uncharacterized protein LOC108094910 n=1 Tax=Drosophila ficusphila TaxID=30025 RepID=UPI0007E7847F|nr:uncharacterized protein LOC108094910 [Drosophila ficusphila]
MVGLLMRFLWSLALLQCIDVGLAEGPPFNDRDCDFIGDANIKCPPKSKLQNAYYFNMPVYKLNRHGIPTTTTTTTEAPVVGYPADLLEIASKVGLKDLPSIEELGKLIGTDNPSDTINYIRALVGTDEGIEMIKQFLNTLQFEKIEEDKPMEDNENIDNNDEINAMEDYLGRERYTTPTVGQRYNLMPGHLPAPINPPFMPYFVAPPSRFGRIPPFLVRSPLPYHYPIPLPPPGANHNAPRFHMPTHNTPNTPKPHLNTLKPQVDAVIKFSNLPPHVQRLAKLLDIPPRVVDQFLKNQPKLADLAKRLSTLALSPEQTQDMDSQVLQAVRNALSNNDDLKRLIEASMALK